MPRTTIPTGTHTLTTDTAARFGAELAPRIVETIAGLYGGRLAACIEPTELPGVPVRVHIGAVVPPDLPARRYPHPLNITLAWDGREVEGLFGADGPARFARYLEALPAKLAAWQEPRQIDLPSRSQADPAVLIGGLDFER